MGLKVGEQLVSILVPGRKRFLDVQRTNQVWIERERTAKLELVLYFSQQRTVYPCENLFVLICLHK